MTVFPRFNLRRVLLGAALSMLAFGLVLPERAQAHNHGTKVGAITIETPWAAATAPGAKVGAVYFDSMLNAGAADQLVSARSSVSETVEIHEMFMEGSVMRMRALTQVDLPTGVPVKWGRSSPKGIHIMLIGLKEPLQEGATIPLTLKFKQAGEVEVKVSVRSIKAQAAGASHKD